MRRPGLVRGRAHLAVALCAAGVALAGCTTTAASTATVSGTTLTIYASAPPGAADDARAQDVLAAEELAFAQSGGRTGKFALKLDVLHGASVSDDARTAIQDNDAIAYVGEIIPGASAASLGIVGDLGLLQVSPTDNAVELTQPSGAVAGSPTVYIEATGAQRTFARVVPTSAREARALVADAGALHVSKLYVTSDGSDYGAALALAVHQAAGAGLTVVTGRPSAGAFSASGAEGLVYATADKAAATRLFDAVAQANPGVRLFAPSALADQSFATALSPAAQAALQVSSPGFLPADLNASGRRFVAAFTLAYHRAPTPEAIFGYEAMAAVLGVLREAGAGADERTTVLKDFFAIRNRSSVLGTYSIDANGDTNLAPFVISRVRAGQLTPYRFVSEQG